MLPIKVAVADANREKRNELEQFLQHDKQRLHVLSDKISNKNGRLCDRRLKSRKNMTFIEDNIARVNRLKPRVLLVSTQILLDSDYDFLIELHDDCHDTLVVMLIDNFTEENKILEGLACGARGFLNYDADLISFSKAIYAVERGEAWVPRKMLGRIMDTIMHVNHDCTIEAGLDPSC